MTDKYKRQLEETGVNLADALDRFMGSEAMYDKFLQKFLRDETYKQLEESISAGDTHQAFMHAHTMKGIAANLEIGCLLEILVPMTEDLRNESMDKIPEQRIMLKSRYNQLCNIIRENH